MSERQAPDEPIEGPAEDWGEASQKADQQSFSQAAAADQEEVDRLAARGVDEDDLPDQPARERPSAGGKAEPVDPS